MCVVHPSTANGRLGTPCEAEAEEARRTVLISVLSGLGALRANGGGGLCRDGPPGRLHRCRTAREKVALGALFCAAWPLLQILRGHGAAAGLARPTR